MISSLKNLVVASVADMFSHGPQPLVDTLSHPGDPGLLGPESVSWPVIGDTAAFVGGIRALIVQTAHPEVAAGVEHHSQYRADPLGRLSRTSAYVTETTYGARPEVDAAVATVRRAHRSVRGRSERDLPYNAGHPDMAAWVHNVLTESFLAAHQAYGPRPLAPSAADRFVAEQSRIGRLLGASPLPATAEDLTGWIVDHPALASSAAQHQAIEFLRSPPLPAPVSIGYRLLFNAAVATLPPSFAASTGLQASERQQKLGARAVRGLRWALGSSPSWHLALLRVGAPIPDGRFRQPLPAPNNAITPPA